MRIANPRNAGGTATQPTKPDLFELANALAVDAAELREFLDDELPLSPTRVLAWARADRAEADLVEEYLARHDHRRSTKVTV